MAVSELLNFCAADIIQSIPEHSFSSRSFIWALMTEYEHEYIQLLNEDHSEHPIMNVHQQIGSYLAKHAGKSLPIVATGNREPSLSPFGNDSTTMIWIKQ